VGKGGIQERREGGDKWEVRESPRDIRKGEK